MSIKVHIIDASKASLVMSSEAFKDKIPGSIVSYSLTAKDGLINLQAREDKDTPDAIVVDFNLPDADGVTLIKELRKFYNGPIFMTAHPEKIVDFAVAEELFHYHDACCWIPKPVRHRLLRRFDVTYPSLMVGKGEGRGKRAPKYDGHLINISIGGVCMAVNNPAKLRKDEEFILTLGVPNGLLQGATAISVLKPVLNAVKSGASVGQKKTAGAPSKNAKPVAKLSAASKSKPAQKLKSGAKNKNSLRSGASVEEAPQADLVSVSNPFENLDLKSLQEYKIKATVAWSSDGGRKVGLRFTKIPESQRRNLEVFLKGLST